MNWAHMGREDLQKVSMAVNRLVLLGGSSGKGVGGVGHTGRIMKKVDKRRVVLNIQKGGVQAWVSGNFGGARPTVLYAGQGLAGWGTWVRKGL